jgi:hypothetical protein
MTFSEFENAIKKQTKVEKWYYYFLFTAMILGGFFFLYQVCTRPEFTNHWLAISFFLLVLGCLGLLKLRNRYKIISIPNSATHLEKKAIVANVLSELGESTSLDQNYYSFTYKKKWWSAPFDVRLFYDDGAICFSVQGQGHTNGGIIDFGETERLRKKIALIIKQKIALSSLS